MLQIIRAIIYCPKFHWGAKVLAIALLDLPRSVQPTNAALARKLHTSDSQISEWRQELLRYGFRLTPEIIQP